MGAPPVPFPVCTVPFLLSADIPISDFALCFPFILVFQATVNFYLHAYHDSNLVSIYQAFLTCTLIWSNGFIHSSIHPSHDTYLVNTNYVPGNSVGAGGMVLTKLGMWSPFIRSFQFRDDLGDYLLWPPRTSESLDH